MKTNLSRIEIHPYSQTWSEPAKQIASVLTESVESMYAACGTGDSEQCRSYRRMADSLREKNPILALSLARIASDVSASDEFAAESDAIYARQDENDERRSAEWLSHPVGSYSSGNPEPKLAEALYTAAWGDLYKKAGIKAWIEWQARLGNHWTEEEAASRI